MNAYENIISRRSVKNYSDQKVSRDDLEKIVYAGQCAPSGMNHQAYAFVVVDDEELIHTFSKMNAEIMHADIDPFYNAQALIIVFANKNVPTHQYDGSLAMSNLMHAANALGIDSCWIHRAKEMFETKAGQAYLEKWGLKDYVGIGNCILGYRAQELEERKPRTSKVVYA